MQNTKQNIVKHSARLVRQLTRTEGSQLSNKSIISLMVVILFAATACSDLSLELGGTAQSGNNSGSYTVNPTNGKLTVTGLDQYNGQYVVAFGSSGTALDPAYPIVYLYAAKAISTRPLFTAGKIEDGKVELDVWFCYLDKKAMENYDHSARTFFFVHVINKTTFTLADELRVGDYLYKNSGKPAWLIELGSIEGFSVDGICEGEFSVIVP